MESLGILDDNLIGVHSCKLTDQEANYLGQASATTVHCPTTNMFMADGISPISVLSKLGAKVCIGTDGAASTGRLDMFGEIKTAALLQKIFYDNPAQIRASDVLSMATSNGANALGIEAGVLKAGYLADITVLDMNRVNTVFSQDPVAAIVYSANTENVDSVMVNGRFVLEGKELKTIDEEKTLAEGKRAARLLLGR